MAVVDVSLENRDGKKFSMSFLANLQNLARWEIGYAKKVR